jgi:hypothetical protein
VFRVSRCNATFNIAAQVEMLDDAYAQYKAKAGGRVVKRSLPKRR